MIEKWKLSLKEFLKDYEEDDNVIGALLGGSYADNSYEENDRLYVYLIMKDEANYNERGVVEKNSYLIDYHIYPICNIKEKIRTEYFNNDFSTINVFAFGKIIYDLEEEVKELQSFALDYIDKPLGVISTNKLDLNNYYIWDKLEGLKSALKDNNYEFNLLYYNLLEKVYDSYCEYQSIPKLEKGKVYKILSNEKYRNKNHVYKIPNENFIKLYLICFEVDKPNNMYKNIEKLVNYYYKIQGGFNIRIFKLRSEIDDNRGNY